MSACLLYARFSTEQQNPLGCRDQLRQCRDHAGRRSWRVLREYSDEAISGAIGETGRSGWAALLHDVRAGLLPEGGRVLVWSISRWSRDFRDGMIAALELDRYGVILADCTGREYDLSDIAGTINLTVEQHKAASFLSELRLAVKRGMAAKRDEGYWTGTPPYGYVVVRDYQARCSTLAPHPQQADVVRRIFRELADGASPTQVARDLGRAGIPAARGGAWHPATVRNIACNPTYRGLIVHYADGQRGGRRFNGATVTAQPGRHPALVDETTWHFARSRLPGEGDARRKCRARQWPLAGLLHCAACGKRMVVSGGRLPYRYFRCLFSDSHPAHRDALGTCLMDYIKGNVTETPLDDFSGALSRALEVGKGATLFFYLDPYGIKDLDFETVKQIYERDTTQSTEVLINFNFKTFMRMSGNWSYTDSASDVARKVKEGKVETVNAVMGGDYWMAIVTDPTLDKIQREELVVGKYMERVREFFHYAYSIPVRELDERGTSVPADELAKYHLIFGTRSPRAVVYMNDVAINALEPYFRQFKDGLLFDMTPGRYEPCPIDDVKSSIIAAVDLRPMTRPQIFEAVIPKYFMQRRLKEYRAIINSLTFEEERLFPDRRRMKRKSQLNDETPLSAKPWP